MAIMYHWQFGCSNYVTTGRTWEDFVTFIRVIQKILNLSDEKRLLIYVHNLAFEFAFMRKWFKWDKVFLLDSRRPVSCVTGGIEFRDSLILYGNKSLANVAKDLMKHDIRKLKGDLDYSLLRHSATPLTEKELQYCYNDVLILTAALDEKIEQDGDITKVPLTNTGYVREYVKKVCFKRWKNYKPMIDNLRLTPAIYLECKDAYQGGFTHANAEYVNKVLENMMSVDFASSYPAQMVLGYYPMGAPIRFDNAYATTHLEELCSKYCCCFELEIHDVEPILTQDYPISVSKCRFENKVERNETVVSNGRVVSAPVIRTMITEQDYWTYKEFYDWDSLNVQTRGMICWERGKLPKPLIEAMLQLYYNKTALKGIKEELVNYNVSKNMINSVYGMMVTAVIRDEYPYDLDRNEFLPKTQGDAETEIEKYNEKKNRVLYYPWGVWITANARRALFKMIKALGNDYVYSDTDCVKFLNPLKHIHKIINYNQQVRRDLKKVSEYYGIPLEKFMPKDKHGKAHPLGVWTYDPEHDYYSRFKTLGAKRYLLESKKTGERELTVAGLRKKSADGKNGLAWISRDGRDPFDEFYLPIGDEWDKDADCLVVPPEYSGRMTLSYFDTEIRGTLTDYLGNTHEYHELSGVYMEPSAYTLSVSSEFEQYLIQLIDKEDKMVTYGGIL